MNDLRRRFEVIRACGIFSNWSRLEILRMARMGFIRSYKTGDIIIEQGKRSEYLYLIVQGVCKVSKRADKTEILGRLLAEARMKASNHDMKYSFHHRLRNNLAVVQREDVVSKHPGVHLSQTTVESGATHQHTNTPSFGQQSTPHDHPIDAVKIPENLASATHISLSEIHRAHITEEILFLEKKLAHEQAVKAKEEQEFEAALEAALKGSSKGMTIPSREANDCDICQLYWPRFFGEICILDPVVSSNLGTVKADSACEIFSIHVNQLHTFHIGENLIERIVDRKIKYPDDTELMAKIDKDRLWGKYRQVLMEQIPKTRWPSKEFEYDQMVFSSN